eukprot:6313352-Pyramimonas_sp.AAC.1
MAAAFASNSTTIKQGGARARGGPDPEQHQGLRARHPAEGSQDGGGLRQQLHGDPGGVEARGGVDPGQHQGVRERHPAEGPHDGGAFRQQLHGDPGD